MKVPVPNTDKFVEVENATRFMAVQHDGTDVIIVAVSRTNGGDVLDLRRFHEADDGYIPGTGLRMTGAVAKEVIELLGFVGRTVLGRSA